MRSSRAGESAEDRRRSREKYRLGAGSDPAFGGRSHLAGGTLDSGVRQCGMVWWALALHPLSPRGLWGCCASPHLTILALPTPESRLPPASCERPPNAGSEPAPSLYFSLLPPLSSADSPARLDRILSSFSQTGALEDLLCLLRPARAPAHRVVRSLPCAWGALRWL